MNSIPPSCVGVQILSHVALCIPRFDRYELHQNRAITHAKLSHISNEDKKLDITYDGNARAMVFIMISFPPHDSQRANHPLIIP